MVKRIDRGSDDKSARIRFHISSGRMAITKLSYVAFQRWLDDMERSVFHCTDCGWRGLGKNMIPMEVDALDAFSIEHEAESWYACPCCESEVQVAKPVMKPV